MTNLAIIYGQYFVWLYYRVMTGFCRSISKRKMICFHIISVKWFCFFLKKGTKILEYLFIIEIIISYRFFMIEYVYSSMYCLIVSGNLSLVFNLTAIPYVSWLSSLSSNVLGYVASVVDEPVILYYFEASHCLPYALPAAEFKNDSTMPYIILLLSGASWYLNFSDIR